MKKIYIHIGTHKTGTTAIQSFSAQNLKLLEKLGIYYPTVCRPTNGGIKNAHHLLPWYLMSHPVPGHFYGKYENEKELLITDLLNEVSNTKCDSILLSSEEFDCLNQKQIENLKNIFIEFDVKVILYLRRKDEYLESMYHTAVMYHNESRTITDMITNMRMPINYYEFVNRWQCIFGIENVHVNFYCKNIMKNSNVVIDMFNRLGFNIEEKFKKSSKTFVNQSVPLHYIAAIVTLRKMGVGIHLLDNVKKIAKKIGDKTDRSYHILTLDEIKKYSVSGFEEVKSLNLSIPDENCFLISDFEASNIQKKGNYSALQKVFADFEKLLS